ncbi:tetratricopeptide repeat domain-containing protein [Diaporthe amygdali]|uniref:tetratricopeptide repeat domain-containing protein n=1 Tax=Phomopsis amygdali TaxID=1214568 RepID=UPI0022FDF814|nr:tetratricopeptide repeat domain-containing protein [Diaporthe amygdali]KAJ0120519.1 tetratricopeptide repeat domain-containing protein [Diaporthe amygdali]
MADFEMERLMSACRSFHDLQMTIPIMSIYEGRETKFRESLLGSMRRKNNQNTLLITRPMVEVKAVRETLFQVDKTHTELCNVEDTDPVYPRLTQFFSSFAQNAPSNVKYTFRQVPQEEMEQMNLRGRNSTSSFGDTSFSTPQTTTYTPESRSSEFAEQSDGGALLREDSSSVAGPQSVQMPFAHFASISRNPKFYGRHDILDEIDYAFGMKTRPEPDPTDQHPSSPIGAEGLNIPKTFVLCGMAGIGKTETAIEYAYSRRDKFDAIIWIYADTSRKLGSQFVTLAKKLGGQSISEALDEISARDVVKSWLTSPVGHRIQGGRSQRVDVTWLMVFDNADDPDVLYDWLPDQGPGCILVTGKYPYVKEHSPRLEWGLDLEPFTTHSASEMLRKLSGRQQDPDAWAASKRIVQTLGGHPLAISQMSAIILQRHLSLNDFEEWYEEDSKHLRDMRVKGPQSTYKHTVGTAWAVEQLSDPAIALLNVLSVLDPDLIPEDMLLDGAKNVTLPNYPVKKRHYFDARAELIHTSLVSRNLASNEIRLHRLVQDVVRENMDDELLHSVYGAVAVLLSAVWPFVSGTDPTRNQAWRVPIADRYTPHICKLEEHFGESIKEGSFNGTEISGFVFSSYAWYISERGLPDQSERFASMSQTILEKAIKRGADDEERVSHWLGEAHHSQSLSACLTNSSDGMKDVTMWIDILHDRIKRYGLDSDKLALATAYNQMGICLITLHKVEEAKSSWRQSIAAYKSVSDAPAFSGTFPSISLSLMCALQGEDDEAEQVLRPMLEEHERILGKDDTSTTGSGHIWRAMGNIRNVQGRYDEALEYHERAVRNISITLGEKHYFTGDCLYSLATDLLRQGKNERGLSTLDDAIKAFKAAPHREAQAARALWKKGCILKASGKASECAQLFQEAMRLRHAVVHDDHRAVEDLEDEDWTKPIMYWSR